MTGSISISVPLVLFVLIASSQFALGCIIHLEMEDIRNSESKIDKIYLNSAVFVSIFIFEVWIYVIYMKIIERYGL